MNGMTRIHLIGVCGTAMATRAALLTRRGNNASVIAALVTGVAVVALTQDVVFRRITAALPGGPRTIAFTWAMPVATGLAFLVCVSGRGRVNEGRNGESATAA